MSTPVSKLPATRPEQELEYKKVQKYRSLIELSTWLVPALLLFLGIIAGLHIVAAGEEALGTSDLVPWGLLIAAYVLLAVTCSGLCMISSLGHILHIRKMEIVLQRAILLAIIILIAGFATLATELGHPLRLIYVLFSPNFTSGIWWMGTIYGIYLVALIVELYIQQTGKHNLARIMYIITLILAVAATSNLGSVFGLINARPFWSGPYWSIYILITAIMSGLAVVTVLAWLMQRKERGYRGDAFRSSLKTTSKGLAILLVLTGVLTFWKITTSLYGGIPAKELATLALLKGPLAVPFWLFEIGLGIVVPLVLIIAGRSERLNYNLLAALSSLVGIVFMRYNMVIAGQLVPAGNLDVQQAFEGFANYLPSSSEILVVIGAISFIILAYRIGEYFLKLD